MKAGTFNIDDYLEKLHEEASDGNIKGSDKEGLIIPEENKKSYGWLKKEYEKGKVEVKVEIHMGGTKFEPGYELQTDLKSVKDFKPGMYGEIKTSDTPGAKTDKKEDTAKTTAENEGNKPNNEKKAEASTGDKGAKSAIKAEVKTAEDTKKPEGKAVEKEEKSDKKPENKEEDKEKKNKFTKFKKS
jgi:hypothetical protein